MVNGIVNVYKEKGYTSHDVVAKLRGIMGQRKIGHAGTLDPDAEGVLVVCLGAATRACGMLTERDKEYEAVLLLGRTTDTQDATGETVREREVSCSPDQAKEAVLRFVGPYMQVPPMYSARKVHGKKLCDLARKGIEVEREPRETRIDSIDVEDVSLPRVRMRVRCSKGTYIRTLCHDIGESLGCGGCMESLVRTEASGFSREDSWTIGQVEAAADKARVAHPGKELSNGDFPGMVAGTDSLFLGYPAIFVKKEFQKPLANGNPIRPEWVARAAPGHPAGLPEENKGERENLLRVYGEDHRFAGIYRHEGGLLRPVKVFLATGS